MVDTKKTEQPTIAPLDERIADGDAEQQDSTYQNYLFPDANNGQGVTVKARTPKEAAAKLEKLEGSK